MQSTLEECREAYAHWIRMVLGQRPLCQHLLFQFMQEFEQVYFLFFLLSLEAHELLKQKKLENQEG